MTAMQDPKERDAKTMSLGHAREVVALCGQFINSVRPYSSRTIRFLEHRRSACLARIAELAAKGLQS